ncbi:pseudouridine synthase [Gracilinema caldarium]|uniref:Pseudouridine synthase n=1 Tax=Gracilinema caldarium (strain ATCC 51460 / DSM 7334 / H1) TaxID=744872 RepID=F8F150_GRAC1|nr:pseudouridine synthase [Gracilinema caldarium]AEJ20840.1 pseudouridine synthase Rsu [Gracilinema caldarium DSM 7334]
MAKISALKILQSQGFGSRNECSALIRQKHVHIDERPVADPAEEWDYETIRFIKIDTDTWPFFSQLYLALNKPSGYECSQQPTHHPSVFELFPPQFIKRGIQSAGRLDWDTEGLLLFTDDGPCIHALTSPKKQVTKTYRAGTARPITDEIITKLKTGVLLRDETEPVRAQECIKTGELELELVIDEGKYHQVRRMIAAAGNHCTRLERIAIGSLQLSDLHLERGQWCYLSAEQLAAAGFKTSP